MKRVIKNIKGLTLYTIAYFFGMYALLLVLNGVLVFLAESFSSLEMLIPVVNWVEWYGVLLVFVLTVTFLWRDIDELKKTKYILLITFVFALVYYFDFYLRGL